MISYEKLFTLWRLMYKKGGHVMVGSLCCLQHQGVAFRNQRIVGRVLTEAAEGYVSKRGSLPVLLEESDFKTNALSQYYIRCEVATKLKQNCSWLCRFSGAMLLLRIILNPSSSTTLALHALYSSCRLPSGHFCSVFFFWKKLEYVHKNFCRHKGEKKKSKFQGL